MGIALEILQRTGFEVYLSIKQAELKYKWSVLRA
jgi:hypothetical protein